MTQRFHYVKFKCKYALASRTSVPADDTTGESKGNRAADRYNAGAGREATEGGWARLDSNQGPRDYESPALTD